MDSTTTSAATPSKSTSTTCAASSDPPSSPTTRAGVTASRDRAESERPWSLRRRMAIAAALAACGVFVMLGLLVYRAVASNTAIQFDEMLAQHAALALRYAEHEYGEGETVVPGSVSETSAAMPFASLYQVATRTNELLYRSPGAPREALATAVRFSDAGLWGAPWAVPPPAAAPPPGGHSHGRAARSTRYAAVAHHARRGRAARL